MSKDAADDPYAVQRRPFVVRCTECGEVAPVAGLRTPEGGTDQTPYDALCADCEAIERRVWGNRRLGQFERGDEFGRLYYDGVFYGFIVLCPRCGGSGRVEPYGKCFGCEGLRYDILDPKGVRRTARWWQTFQQNRTNHQLTQTRQADSPPAD